MPHSDELGALARALTGTTRVLSDWFGLAHSAPTSDVLCRHSGTGAAAPATASATIVPHEAEQGEPEHPERHDHARFKSGGVRAQNVCCLVRSDDSHRQRASILT